MNYIPILTIAGSDPSGGAGIQADIKTISALGGYAAAAITAITVQNTLGVAKVVPIEASIVAEQIEAVVSDIKPAAIKIGMVNDATTLQAIVKALEGYERSIVADPVIKSTSGHRLMSDGALKCFIAELLPKATLITPNIPETEIIAGMAISDAAAADKAARRIIDMGCDALLIKGGHREGHEKRDVLYTSCGERHEYTLPSISTRNTHGTGCTLSSAIATFIARGERMESAVAKAKEYLYRAIKEGAAMEIGSGHGPVNHFFAPVKAITVR